jgi:hypothetical protein
MGQAKSRLEDFFDELLSASGYLMAGQVMPTANWG